MKIVFKDLNLLYDINININIFFLWIFFDLIVEHVSFKIK